MTNEKFLNEVDKLYQNYQEYFGWRNLKLESILGKHLGKHIQDDELNAKVHVKDYKLVEDGVYLYTDIGTFLVKDKEIEISTLDTLKNSSISFLDFFYQLENENLSVNFSKTVTDILYYQNKKFSDLFRYYMTYYYNYLDLLDSSKWNRLYKSYMEKDYYHQTVVSLEVLNHPDFHDYRVTSMRQEKLEEVKLIFSQYISSVQNQRLLFSSFLLSKDYEKVEYIEEHMEAFKEFIIEEVSKTPYLNPRLKMACEYLKESNLISSFSEEELLRMYQKNTSYYLSFPDQFQNVVKRFENKSPMVYLDATKKEKIHIRYFPHQLIDGVPFDYHIRYNIEKNDRLSFKNLFLYNNESICQFYSMYFKKYQNEIGKEGNLFDFIRYLFHTKTISSIYRSPNITVGMTHELEQFLPFYEKKIQQDILLVKEELRKRNLKFYNSIVVEKENHEKLNQILSQNGLNRENCYSFLIQNKFLDTKQKEGLLTILKNHFQEGYCIYDILAILDEAKSRKISLDEVLEEKEISKRKWEEMYESAEEENPILYQCMFFAMNHLERKRYIRLATFGYHVACGTINSIKEYEEKFPNSPSYYDLIEDLQETNIAPKLIEKANVFEDFNLWKMVKQKNKTYKKNKT